MNLNTIFRGFKICNIQTKVKYDGFNTEIRLVFTLYGRYINIYILFFIYSFSAIKLKRTYLPYQEASVVVSENSPSDSRYKSRMTIAGIDIFMPNPMNRKLCATVANVCNIRFVRSVGTGKIFDSDRFRYFFYADYRKMCLLPAPTSPSVHI